MIKNSLQLSAAEAQVRSQIHALFEKVLNKKFDENLLIFDYPPDVSLGDYSVSCFLIAKAVKKNPNQLATTLAQNFQPSELLVKAQATGPYLNFFVNRLAFAGLVLGEINKAKNKYGSSKSGKGQKVMVEYFSPNTNKPLTIGHVRNICLGEAIVNLLEFSGYKVITSTLYNDRGIAIAKTMLGYQKWGKGQNPKKAKRKPDHFVGDFYVRFSQAAKTDEQLEKEAQRLLQAWEDDDKTARDLWQKLTTWVLEGFKQTLKKLGVQRFDEEYYDKGKQVVETGLKKGVFVKDQAGVVYAPLEKFRLPDKIVLRPDSTSLYITQDLYLAYLKDKHNVDASVYVVGSEQELYFQQLFKILELLGFENAKHYHHLSYGMIRLRSGKIKSREGLVKGTGADELISELEELAKQEITKRFRELEEKEVLTRAEQITLAALKFYILVVSPKTTMVFDPKQSIAFTGKTGPYLQYVYARINSIFAKVGEKTALKGDAKLLIDDVEFSLIKLLAQFPAKVNQAAANYDPAQLANYLYELAKAFSMFYEQLPVLQSEKKLQKARLMLIKNVKLVLGTGLELLGIPVLEKM